MLQASRPNKPITQAPITHTHPSHTRTHHTHAPITHTRPNRSYEFTSPNGLHVAMSAAAQRGNVYVCGVSAAGGDWGQAKEVAAEVVRSFRIKSSAAATS